MTDIHKVRKYSIFDPTTQAGNGKRGPRGPAGANGDDGTDGTDGSQILTGSGVPSNGTGNDGDWYWRTNGFVYQKQSGVWVFIDDLTGPTGATGATGSPGAGMVWRGAWNSGTAYVVGDGVEHNGSSYIATANGTNHAPPNASFWDLIAAEGATGATGAAGTGITWLGAWSGATAYVQFDAVEHNGSAYVANAAGTNHAPPNASFWDLLASKGDTGTSGSTGADGAQQPFGGYWTGGGSVITLSDKFITLPRQTQNGTILQVNVQGDETGSAVIGIKKCAHGSYPGSLADITGGSDITLASVIEYHDATLSGWTVSYSSGDIYEFELKSVSGFKRLGIALSPV